ncbi:S-methyl-5-thioribose-1-phosphate isomerase [Acidithiobacillus concretivorus]|uniref:Methylthioribose-1-phosphate isomerase n=1 Tax=Acidithiobacillus concretivorus TaxID=3063952 RepID=A0ABS5ZQE3_9PROT|nr:S-methyl-5-thioribose-1-phosphate isomerase [Acidithiobacillus concretivorus]
MPIVDNIRAIRWEDHQLCLLDQRLLPQQEIWLQLGDYREVAVAITQMVVRGAPAIGVTAAYAMALAVQEMQQFSDWQQRLAGAAAEIKAARPTAVNLAWATDRQLTLAQGESAADRAATLLLQAAHDLLEQDIADNQQMGRHGAALLPEQGGILTHCNTGSLATGGYGTALGVIRAGISAGKQLQVYADETRPWLQGARLTAWELQKDGIPFYLNADSAAAYLMQQGLIQAVIVGADRIAANGDTANKIGTYSLAVLAQYHQIPFYVAAPLSTVDFAMPAGEGIIIEERPDSEVRQCAGHDVAPAGVKVRNPAFDVTPAALITAIITEKGVARPDYLHSLANQRG